MTFGGRGPLWSLAVEEQSRGRRPGRCEPPVEASAKFGVQGTRVRYRRFHEGKSHFGLQCVADFSQTLKNVSYP